MEPTTYSDEPPPEYIPKTDYASYKEEEYTPEPACPEHHISEQTDHIEKKIAEIRLKDHDGCDLEQAVYEIMCEASALPKLMHAITASTPKKRLV